MCHDATSCWARLSLQTGSVCSGTGALLAAYHSHPPSYNVSTLLHVAVHLSLKIPSTACHLPQVGTLSDGDGRNVWGTQPAASGGIVWRRPSTAARCRLQLRSRLRCAVQAALYPSCTRDRHVQIRSHELEAEESPVRPLCSPGTGVVEELTPVGGCWLPSGGWRLEGGSWLANCGMLCWKAAAQ